MKLLFKKVCFIMLLCGSSGIAFADHVTGPIELKVVQVLNANGKVLESPNVDQPVFLRLKIISSIAQGDYGHKVLVPEDLIINHEKLFHFFGFDRNLTHLIHEHPIYQNDGTWLVQVVFKTEGTYHLWADVMLNQAPPAETTIGYECTGSDLVRVIGDSFLVSSQPDLRTQLSASDGDSVLSLATSEVHAGEMAMIPIHFSSLSGAAPAITPYLGTIAHFLVTNPSGTKIYHVHPMEMGGEWMIHLALPAGSFRIFAQFIDHGELKTVALALTVN